MSNWQYCNIVPTKQFRSANALPRELGLYTQDGELYLSAAPVAETKTLRKENKEIPS
ncbi:levanase domain protein, partial [Bacteroides fragilis str. 3397 T10]